MIRNYRLVIEYDGGDFHGWQKQKNDRTVQGEIEKALAVMSGQKVILTGSGRTDAGVHAYAQSANFRCDAALGPEVFRKGLNSLLPDDIANVDCRYADARFHARYDAKCKVYRYTILNRSTPSAIFRRYVWFIRKPLEATAMTAAARHLVGTHDFKAFEGSGSPRSSTVRTVFRAEVHRDDAANIVFEIEADGFLRFMVRNMVGTLVDVGLGRLTPEGFKDVLLSRDRGRAGATAPSRGLFLVRVVY